MVLNKRGTHKTQIWNATKMKIVELGFIYCGIFLRVRHRTSLNCYLKWGHGNKHLNNNNILLHSKGFLRTNPINEVSNQCMLVHF